MSVSDQAVAAYRDLCEELARPLAGRNCADADDLVQEGMIAVWLALDRGITPAREVIRGRMVDWVRLQGRQLRGDPVPYEDLLPFIDRHELDADAAGRRL